MPAHNDTRGWITRTRRSTEAALDGDLWRSLRPLPAAVCTKLLTRLRPTEEALHRQRSYGAASQKNRIAFSLLRKLNDFLGDDFCGESGVINYTHRAQSVFECRRHGGGRFRVLRGVFTKTDERRDCASRYHAGALLVSQATERVVS